MAKSTKTGQKTRTKGDKRGVRSATEPRHQPKDGSETDISRTCAADAAVLVGELHLRQGDYVKAIAAFSRAIENGQTADAYQGRAKAYRSLAEQDEQMAREHATEEARPDSSKINASVDKAIGKMKCKPEALPH